MEQIVLHNDMITNIKNIEFFGNPTLISSDPVLTLSKREMRAALSSHNQLSEWFAGRDTLDPCK